MAWEGTLLLGKRLSDSGKREKSPIRQKNLDFNQKKDEENSEVDLKFDPTKIPNLCWKNKKKEGGRYLPRILDGTGRGVDGIFIKFMRAELLPVKPSGSIAPLAEVGRNFPATNEESTPEW